MTAWQKFIREMGDHKQVFVIGPMLQGSFVPQGPTIYVDGGLHARGRAAQDTKFATISVGDGDSATGALDYLLPELKDYSDLAFVLHNLPKTVQHVDLLGFLGGRLDHQLGNFGEAHAFLDSRKDNFTTIRFDESAVGFSAGKLKLQIQGNFSVMAFRACNVTITGACRFALEEPTRLGVLSSHGISNIGNGSVTITAEKPAFIFFN